MSKFLVVVPTYNEVENLPIIAEAIMAISSPEVDLLVVDDNSPDGTGKVADELSTQFPNRIHVIHRPGKSGLGRAYIDGFQWALKQGYESIAQMDADLSHDPLALKGLFEASSEADIVIGSRYLNGVSVINWPLRRILLSLGANVYVRIVLGVGIHDITSGFRVYRSTALHKINLPSISSNGYSFQVEMTYRGILAGCKLVEHPIIFTERRAGHSKMSQGVIVESALMPWRLRLRKGRLIQILKNGAN